MLPEASPISILLGLRIIGSPAMRAIAMAQGSDGAPEMLGKDVVAFEPKDKTI